ncbi:MAG: cytidine deaminase [Acidimicrobiales bacterium]|nr:cytidine deaminase [Acidimicrobiales bacterium]
MTPDWTGLRRAAVHATSRAHSPYSGFPVGAAGALTDGSILTATNVESASLVSGVCAETGLVAIAVAGGQAQALVAVAVTDADGADVSPCGRCRQLLHEIGGPDLVVNERPMSVWLPDAFGAGGPGR